MEASKGKAPLRGCFAPGTDAAGKENSGRAIPGKERHGMKEQLPQEFIARMRGLLGEETDAFLSCYKEDGCSGIRINTARTEPEELARRLPFSLRPVPWTRNGFYTVPGEEVSGHPFYYAGLYYIQEPSAMLPASRLPVFPGERVLDLCAAPGGKATELAARLGGKGLLVANDVSASRAKALLKNLTLWGCPNLCITAETPQRLLGAFGCYFDKILVDAPCSGEGMFRRDSGLIRAWRQRGPQEYAGLQKEILSCAVQMLRPGGMLLYSTCTFSPEEDEEVVAYALKAFPELSLVQPESSEGFLPGLPPQEACIRVFPHRVQGEGHFLALLQKKKDGSFRPQQPEAAGLLPVWEDPAVPPAVRAFAALLPPALTEGGRYMETNGQCYLLPPYRLPAGLRYLRTGIWLGSLTGSRFEPSQALAMLLSADTFAACLRLEADDARVRRYLKGETVSLTEEEAGALALALERSSRRMREALQKQERTGDSKQKYSRQKNCNPKNCNQKNCSQESCSQKSCNRKNCNQKNSKRINGRPSGKEPAVPEGWVLVCVDRYALGWAKYTGDTLKNRYYPGWRLQ